MSMELPEPLAAYFVADKGNGDAMAQCFTDQAVVRDEEQTYSGRAAISRWRREAAAKYNYTSEPIALKEQDGKFIVTSHLEGDFPGSPVDLNYFFVLNGDKIASLEIIG